MISDYDREQLQKVYTHVLLACEKMAEMGADYPLSFAYRAHTRVTSVLQDKLTEALLIADSLRRNDCYLLPISVVDNTDKM